MPPVPLDAALVPDEALAGRRARRLGPGAGAGRGARLPQRPGHGDRADRHHRPGDGLRHHRHRARLRPGQVQEAGRRRLLQDHQPDGAAGAGAGSATAPTRSSGSCATRSATARCADSPAIGHAALRARGFADDGDRRRRAGAGRRLRHPLRLQQVDAGRALLRRAPRHRRPSASTSRASACSRRSASRKRGDRGRQHLRLRGDDAGGRARPQARASAGVRLCLRLRPDRHPPSLGREPHPDDGGRPAVRLRRHLQDHQHAARGHHRGLRRRPTCWPGSSA